YTVMDMMSFILPPAASSRSLNFWKIDLAWMYMSSPGCSPFGPEPVIPAMWKYPFTTFMLDQVCGGASATLGERIVFMLRGLLCEAGSKRARVHALLARRANHLRSSATGVKSQKRK